MNWVKVKWIPKLFDAFNVRFVGRTKASDGTIGDTAHMTGTSGHNPDDTPGVSAERTDSDSVPEVRAADVTSTLPGVKMYDVVQAILRSSDKDRFIYIICDGWIWQKKNGWRREKYYGKDQHFGHAHFSGDPAYDEDASPFNSILHYGAPAPDPTPGKGDDVNLTDGFEIQRFIDDERLPKNGPHGGENTSVAQALGFAQQAGFLAYENTKVLQEKVEGLEAKLDSVLTALAELSKPSGVSVGKLYVDVEKLEGPSSPL